MLLDASSINGYAVEATDGRLGIVSDSLFEDNDWVIRWVVVDSGNLLSGRKVLLPLSALGQLVAMRSLFRVNLTMRQAKGSPDIDTNRTVSRQMETHVYDYYGWDPYWSGGNLGMNAMATSLIAPLWSTSRDRGGADAEPIEGGPDLRSIAAVTGYHIHATDGDVGCRRFPRG